MSVIADRWMLEVTFDSVQETIDAGAYEGGMGEAAEFYAWLREYWEGAGDDLDACTELEGETVRASAPLPDNYVDPLKWLFYHASPQSVRLWRGEPRNKRTGKF